MKVVGRSINRVGGKDRVTGRQRYVADIKLPEMLHARIVTIDCAHARIRSIDISKALEVAGVVSILRGEDLPRPARRYGPVYKDKPLLAIDTVQYHGEPVAIVAAENERAASIAASLVAVDYEELPAVFTVAQALDPASPLVQDPALRKNHPFKDTNILEEYHYGWGDVEGCPADLVIENVYTFPMINHFAIEPFAYLAEPSQGGVTVYSPTQNPYRLQESIAQVFDLPLSKVRILSSDPGGAFGGKQHPKVEHILAYQALLVGRPVRIELTLEESFQAARRTSAEVRMRSGFRRDGSIVFQDVDAAYLGGAYADIAPRLTSKGSYVAAGPYRTPNVRIRGRLLLSHTVPSTAFRGFGIPQVNWAIESQMDAAAAALGMDAVKLRLVNLPARGEIFIPEALPADGLWAETLEKGARAIGWGTPLGAGRGRGIALGLKTGPTNGSSTAIVRLHVDGSATVLSGTSDMGQGARTIFTQIAAEELGIPVEKVNLWMGDTTTVPYDMQTSASRSTVFMGRAIMAACGEVVRQLRELAAKAYNVETAQVTMLAGSLRFPEGEASYAEAMRKIFGKVQGEVIGVGASRSDTVESNPMGGQAAFYEFVCCAAEVQVDRETGETRVEKLVIAGDVGYALNPQHVSMQDEGAAVMGLGHSLMEHYILDGAGRIRNLGALDYRIPTSKDIPAEFQSIHIQNGDGPGPYGAKGVSESGILAVAPTIASAVEQATGVRIRSLPLTPERIWAAMNPIPPASSS